MRAMFPVLFQFVILFLDYTIDKVDPTSMAADKEAPYKNILKKQREVLTKIQEYKSKPAKSLDEFKEIYCEIVSMANKEGNDFIPAVQQDAEEEEKFSAVKFVRLLFGIMMLISLAQFIFFGGAE